MVTNVQKIAKMMGEYGCYFLSLAYIAERITGSRYDIIEEAVYAMDRNSLNFDCFVRNPNDIMANLTGKKYMISKAGPKHSLPLNYILQDGEFEILRFARFDEEGKEIAHFVVGDGSGKVAFDPWKDSATVKLGELVSKRIVRRMA
jgi:hypothetical protein